VLGGDGESQRDGQRGDGQRVEEDGDVEDQTPQPRRTRPEATGAHSHCKRAAQRVTLLHLCDSCMKDWVHGGSAARCVVWCWLRWLGRRQKS
jgi:hypothetical protein